MPFDFDYMYFTVAVAELWGKYAYFDMSAVLNSGCNKDIVFFPTLKISPCFVPE